MEFRRWFSLRLEQAELVFAVFKTLAFVGAVAALSLAPTSPAHQVHLLPLLAFFLLSQLLLHGAAFCRREGLRRILLADLKMPGMSGLELLRATKAIRPAVEVIVITGYGSIEEAVEAMKDGAYDFLTKPVKRVGLLKAIDTALERQALVRENRSLQRRVEELQTQGGIIGKSSAMQRTLDLVQQIAPSTATVLIQGESGTGKEVIATAIHQGSPRRQKPFVKVNCAALPETLLESELFGYERGAFTGPVAAKPSRFELAHGGTLFLDQVGDLRGCLKSPDLSLRATQGAKQSRSESRVS
jgi:DNA-binding NtrC family response regulator